MDFIILLETTTWKLLSACLKYNKSSYLLMDHLKSKPYNKRVKDSDCQWNHRKNRSLASSSRIGLADYTVILRNRTATM